MNADGHPVLATPHHRRTVVTEVLTTTGDAVEMVGRLRDERPSATEPLDLPTIHDPERAVTVSLSDFAAEQKLERGWRPGTTPVPVPPLAEFEE